MDQNKSENKEQGTREKERKKEHYLWLHEPFSLILDARREVTAYFWCNLRTLVLLSLPFQSTLLTMMDQFSFHPHPAHHHHHHLLLWVSYKKKLRIWTLSFWQPSSEWQSSTPLVSYLWILVHVLMLSIVLMKKMMVPSSLVSGQFHPQSTEAPDQLHPHPLLPAHQDLRFLSFRLSQGRTSVYHVHLHVKRKMTMNFFF